MLSLKHTSLKNFSECPSHVLGHEFLACTVPHSFYLRIGGRVALIEFCPRSAFGT